MSAENENGKTAQLEKNEKDAKNEDEVGGDNKSTLTKQEKAEETKLKDGDPKEDSKSEDQKENNKANKDDAKDGTDEKDAKEVKDDTKDKKKDKSDAEDSEKDENVEEEEDVEDEDDADDEDNKKGKKPNPKKKEAQKNAKDNKNDDEGGVELGEIPRIDASISRFKNDDLKLLHKLLFKTPIKTPLLKKNIRKFSGFSFKKSSDEYDKKMASMSTFEVKQLRVICEMLDLEKKGNRDEITERILDFLVEPKDSGKPSGGGRPRRSAAVKANNRGYSDEEYSSDERSSPRAKRNAGRRPNLKDDTSTEESDEDFQPSESEEEKPRTKRGRGGRRKKDDSEEEEESEEDSEDSDYSDEGPKNKQRKIANNKGKGRGGGATRGRRGRPAGTGNTAGAKRKAPGRGRKKQETSEEEEEEESEAREEGASSSEDEPLAKKSAKNPQPPTDDEIKTYVKEILDGANLEEITMKTVCKQVYSHYPDFDLTHKKDYIKTTVKSLIST